MSKLSKKPFWCNSFYWPIRYCFVPSEAAWVALMKELGCDYAYPPYPGSMTPFDCENGPTVCAVVLRYDDEQHPISVVGLLVHEAVHVWQSVREKMGEEKPGSEQEAYAIQAITVELMQAYDKTRMQTAVTK